MNDTAVLATSLALPVLIGVIEAIKRAGCPRRLLPLIALALGIGGGVAWAATHPPVTGDAVVMGVLYGAMIGLSSVGLYSGATNTFRPDDREPLP
jgi:hypothetical protein